jgi:hypothetical protein
MATEATTRRARPSTRQFNVKFSPKAYEMLEQLAEQRQTTMAEVLRDAIALEAYVSKVRDEDGRILVDRGGTITELVPR